MIASLMFCNISQTCATNGKQKGKKEQKKPTIKLPKSLNKALKTAGNSEHAGARLVMQLGITGLSICLAATGLSLIFSSENENESNNNEKKMSRKTKIGWGMFAVAVLGVLSAPRLTRLLHPNPPKKKKK